MRLGRSATCRACDFFGSSRNSCLESRRIAGPTSRSASRNRRHLGAADNQPTPGVEGSLMRISWLPRVRREAARSDDERICKESGLFDAEWYRQRYPDVADTLGGPLSHYFRLGCLEARDPHPLFDTDWYVAQNPDISASGVNPLAHYIRVGAAEGRDPNPLFDTDWYLERHPDVARAGMNPLVHYLHWGSVELREPLSPVPFIFKKLTIKPKTCEIELERLLLIYSSPPDVTPTRARRDNNSQVGVSWAEQDLFECSQRFACGNLEGALRFAKRAIQIVPHEDDPIALFAELFHIRNRSALETFSQR